MKKLLFKILSKYFKDQIEESFIEEEIKEYTFDKKDKVFYKNISNLYQYPEYKVYSKMISNRAKILAFQIAKNKEYNKSKHARVGGQIYCTALIIKIVKHINRIYQNEGEKK